MKKLLSLVNDERGIQHVEEALLLALIAVVAVGSANALGQKVDTTFTAAETGMTPTN